MPEGEAPSKKLGAGDGIIGAGESDPSDVRNGVRIKVAVGESKTETLAVVVGKSTFAACVASDRGTGKVFIM